MLQNETHWHNQRRETNNIDSINQVNKTIETSTDKHIRWSPQSGP